MREKGQELRFDPLWSRVYDEFHSRYGGVCAYTCFFQPDRATIDHFRPKHQYPGLAYEWSNYRLASPRANQFKGNQDDLLDPFLIRDGWFALDLPSCEIRERGGLDDALGEAVKRTIRALKLNDDEYLLRRRLDLLLAFADGCVTQSFVQRMNPFVFDEITRQGLWAEIRRIFRRRRLDG